MKQTLCGLALAATVAGAHASALAVGGGWEAFSFGAAGSSFSRTFDFSVAGPALFRITDAGLSGDRFSVTSLGTTSAPVLGGDVGGAYLQAFADPRFSSGTYLLSSGAYAIGGTVVDSPFGSGVFAAARADLVELVNLTVGSGWQQFSFGAVDSSWNRAFQLTLSESATVTVQDGGLSGDRFYVDGFGLTSAPTQGGDVGANYDAAFADARFSRLQLTLGPGSYLIAGLAFDSPFEGGVYAAVRVDPVPEPATWAMMALGLGLLAFVFRRRRGA